MKEVHGTKLPCPACGGSSYSWGWIRAQLLRFVPDDASLWERYIRGGRRLRGRRCDGCGNLQIFAGPDLTGADKRSRDAEELDFP